MITFWCHQPKQFPKMGTRERLPTEVLEGNEKKAIFKDSKCFYLKSLASILDLSQSCALEWVGVQHSRVMSESDILVVAIGSLLKLFIVGGSKHAGFEEGGLSGLILSRKVS